MRKGEEENKRVEGKEKKLGGGELPKLRFNTTPRPVM